MSSYANLSPRRKLLVFTFVALTTFYSMGDFVITPISYLFYELFNNEMAVNYLLTGPYIVAAIMFLVVGRIADKANKKLLLCLGVALYGIGSIFGVAVEDVYYMSVMHSLSAGIGYPLIQTAGLTILAEMYTDEKEHGKYVGFYNAAMSIFGAMESAIAGVVALTGWQNVYLIYLFGILVLLGCVFCIPSVKVVASSSAASSEVVKVEVKGWYKAIVPLCIMVFIAGICYMSVVYMGSVYVADTGIGNESYAGLVSSLGTIGACITSALFVVIFTKLRDYVPVVSFACMGVLFLILVFVPVRPVVTVTWLCTGLAWGVFQSYFYARVSDLVPDGYQGQAIGLVSFMYMVGCFLTTYVSVGLEHLLGVATIVGPWLVMGIVFFVMAMCAVFMAKKLDKSSQC